MRHFKCYIIVAKVSFGLRIYIYIYIYIAIVDALKKQYYFVFVGNLLHLSVSLALV